MNATWSEAIRKGIRTFVIATLAIAIPGLLGWLNELTEWAKGNGTTPMPDAHGLLFLAVSAVTAGFIALLNIIWIVVEDATGKGFLRTPNPTQNPGEGGYYRPQPFVTVLIAAAIILVLLIIIF